MAQRPRLPPSAPRSNLSPKGAFVNITYVSNSTLPSRDANGVHVLKMCSAFANLGHHVHLTCYGSEESEAAIFDAYGFTPQFPITAIKRPRIRFIGPLRSAWNLRRALKNSQAPDLLYGRNPLGLLALLGKHVPFIYEAHAPPHNLGRQWIERQLLRRQGFVLLVVISQALKQEYLRVFPFLKKQQVHVAPDGADAPTNEGPEWAGPANHGSRLQVGYTGHLYPGRGVEMMVALARRLPQQDFHFVGGTEADLGRWRRAQVPDNVQFHGFVPQAQVPDRLADFQVVVAPYQHRVSVSGGRGDTSRWMSPLKVFEYMAAGRAIVASDLPVLREVLNDGENALLVPPTDLDAWEQALKKLGENPDLRHQLAQAAHDALVRRFTWTIRADHILTAFQSHQSAI